MSHGATILPRDVRNILQHPKLAEKICKSPWKLYVETIKSDLVELSFVY